MDIVFWGTQSLFSHTVLAALLADGQAVSAVFVFARGAGPAAIVAPPAAPPGEILLTPRHAFDTVTLAWQRDIPVFRVDDVHHSATHAALAAQAAAVACVACFPQRIPPALLAIPRHGFLNVHPSLLPAYRGPAPLFWQLRAGERAVGVTIHWMDAHVDTGPIAGQTPCGLPDGVTGPEADRLLATTGGKLLADLLRRLAAGHRPQQPQPAGGSYQPWPQAPDFALDLTWTAQHAFNFMRGTAEWGYRYPLTVDGEQLLLAAARAVCADAQLDTPCRLTGADVHIQFARGVLVAIPSIGP